MSTDLNGERQRLLEAYLDGLLSGPQREAFEQRLAGDAALRAEVEAQVALDAALLRQFEPPPAERLLARIGTAGGATNGRTAAAKPSRKPPQAGKTRRLLLIATRDLAIAAVVSVAIFGGWWFWKSRQEPTRPGVPPWQSMETVYRSNHKGLWQCPPDVFAFTFSYRLGQPLMLAALPQGLECLGLNYTHTITPNTIYMLVKANGRDILVFADRADADRGQSVSPTSGLHLFPRRVGELILYELTPFDRPQVLDRLEIPLKPAPTTSSQPE